MQMGTTVTSVGISSELFRSGIVCAIIVRNRNSSLAVKLATNYLPSTTTQVRSTGIPHTYTMPESGHRLYVKGEPLLDSRRAVANSNPTHNSRTSWAMPFSFTYLRAERA
jgi:hypothetical protein